MLLSDEEGRGRGLLDANVAVEITIRDNYIK